MCKGTSEVTCSNPCSIGVPGTMFRKLLISKQQTPQPLWDTRSSAPVLAHAQNYILISLRNCLWCTLCPFPIVLAVGTTAQSLVLTSLQPPFRYLWTMMRFPRPPLVQAVLNSLMGEVLQAPHHLSGRLLKYHQYVQVFLLLGSPGLDTGHGLRKCPAEGKDHLPWPTVNRLLTQLRILLIFSVARAHFWLMFSLLSTRSPRSFSSPNSLTQVMSDT